MSNRTSQHILSTSANLLGFCLFVITSLHISNYAESSIIDELTSVIALFLILSCLLSFFSIQSKNVKKANLTEKIADYCFALSLVGILLVILLIAFHFIK